MPPPASPRPRAHRTPPAGVAWRAAGSSCSGTVPCHVTWTRKVHREVVRVAIDNAYLGGEPIPRRAHRHRGAPRRAPSSAADRSAADRSARAPTSSARARRPDRSRLPASARPLSAARGSRARAVPARGRVSGRRRSSSHSAVPCLARSSAVQRGPARSSAARRASWDFTPAICAFF